MLAEDHVPLNARVSDAVDSRHVANGDGRHCDTVGVINDRCHAREETEKYVDVFTAVRSRKYTVHANTHDRFYGPFSGTTRVSLCQKKFFWTFMVQEEITEADTPTIQLGATPS